MADGEPQAADVPGGKSSGWLKRFAFIIYILAGMLIISGGIMGAMLLGWIQIEQPAAGERRASRGPRKTRQTPEKPPEMGPTLKLSSLVINLNEPSGFHFVKAAVVLELGKADDLEKIKERTAPLTDTVILTLGDQRLTDLMNPEYRETLKKGIVDQAEPAHASPRRSRSCILTNLFINKGIFAKPSKDDGFAKIP